MKFATRLALIGVSVSTRCRAMDDTFSYESLTQYFNWENDLPTGAFNYGEDHDPLFNSISSNQETISGALNTNTRNVDPTGIHDESLNHMDVVIPQVHPSNQVENRQFERQWQMVQLLEDPPNQKEVAESSSNPNIGKDHKRKESLYSDSSLLRASKRPQVDTNGQSPRVQSLLNNPKSSSGINQPNKTIKDLESKTPHPSIDHPVNLIVANQEAHQSGIRNRNLPDIIAEGINEPPRSPPNTNTILTSLSFSPECFKEESPSEVHELMLRRLLAVSGRFRIPKLQIPEGKRRICDHFRRKKRISSSFSKIRAQETIDTKSRKSIFRWAFNHFFDHEKRWVEYFLKKSNFDLRSLYITKVENKPFDSVFPIFLFYAEMIIEILPAPSSAEEGAQLSQTTNQQNFDLKSACESFTKLVESLNISQDKINDPLLSKKKAELGNRPSRKRGTVVQANIWTFLEFWMVNERPSLFKMVASKNVPWTVHISFKFFFNTIFALSIKNLTKWISSQGSLVTN